MFADCINIDYAVVYRCITQICRSIFSGVRVTRSLVLYACFVDHCLSFLYFFFWPLCCLFFFDITGSDYPFGIFKLFSR